MTELAISQSSGRATSAWLFSAGAFLIMPFSIFLHKGLAPLFVGLAFAACASRIYARIPFDRPGRISAILIAFIALAMVSAVWSPSYVDTLQTSISFALTAIGTALLIQDARFFDARQYRTLQIAIVAGGAVGFGLLFVEMTSNGFFLRLLATIRDRPISEAALAIPSILKPGFAVGAIFFWPWAYSLFQLLPRRYAGVATGMGALSVIAGGSDSSVLGLIVGFIFVAIAYFFRRGAIKFLSILIAFAVLLLPVAVGILPDPTLEGSGLGKLSHSAIHRIKIWKTVDLHIAESPFIGHGFDSSRAFYGPESTQTYVMMPDIPELRWTVSSEPIPLHPHNLVMQVWLETGLVGAILLTLFFLAVLSHANEAPSRRRLVIAGAFGSAFVIACIAYGAWQSWWLAALSMTASFITATLVNDTNE